VGDIVVLAVKGLLGGVLVVVFSLLSEALRPKSFAGLFGAAPSIALGALTVTAVTRSPAVAREQSLAMIVGAAAMILYCAAAIPSVDRLGALRGSFVAIGVWFAVAIVGYFVFLAP
jgi:uncharacterized membrane protein (GlpM family)